MSDSLVVWAIVMENHEANIRMLHVERTDHMEDAIWAARTRLHAQFTDKTIGEIVSRNAYPRMYFRLPERRPLHLTEFGTLTEPTQTVKTSQTIPPAVVASMPTAPDSGERAARLLMLIRDQWATETEKPAIQGIIDRLSTTEAVQEAPGLPRTSDPPQDVQSAV